MLSDKEWKAFESVKDMFGDVTLKDIDEQSITIYGIAMLDVIKVLTIVEKLSKEIERQKEKRENQKKELAILNAKQIEFNKLVNTVNSYKGQFKRQQKEIEELKEENEKYKNPPFFDEENYISKKESAQKEKQAWIEGTNVADKLCNKKWEDKIKAKIEYYEKIDNPVGKRVLQSLLEKE